MNESDVSQRILDLITSTNYEIIQTNGQRIYGPPPDWPTDPSKKPPKNTELFVGRLPRDCFEDELVPLFASIGPIYQFRLMVDFSGTNRGYAYVKFIHKSDAQKALKILDKYEIRPNHRIGVVESVDNCRLFIGNLPPNLSRQQLFDTMSDATSGVVSAVLHYNLIKQSIGSEVRGFAFIEYETHRDAAMARRKLLPEKNSRLFGTQISVDWAIPESKGNQQVMSKVSVLFVRYLNYEASEELIKYVFSFKNQFNVIRVKRIKNYAFVHYEDRTTAEMALNRISGIDLSVLAEKGGTPLEVKWSIPPELHKKNKLMAELNYSMKSPERILNPMASPFRPNPEKVTEFQSYQLNGSDRRIRPSNDSINMSLFWRNDDKQSYCQKSRKSLPGFQ